MLINFLLYFYTFRYVFFVFMLIFRTISTATLNRIEPLKNLRYSSQVLLE